MPLLAVRFLSTRLKLPKKNESACPQNVSVHYYQLMLAKRFIFLEARKNGASVRVYMRGVCARARAYWLEGWTQRRNKQKAFETANGRASVNRVHSGLLPVLHTLSARGAPSVNKT